MTNYKIGWGIVLRYTHWKNKKVVYWNPLFLYYLALLNLRF